MSFLALSIAFNRLLIFFAQVAIFRDYTDMKTKQHTLVSRIFGNSCYHVYGASLGREGSQDQPPILLYLAY